MLRKTFKVVIVHFLVKPFKCFHSKITVHLNQRTAHCCWVIIAWQYTLWEISFENTHLSRIIFSVWGLK